MHFNKPNPERVYYDIFKFLEKKLTKETGIYMELNVFGVRFPYENKVIVYSKKGNEITAIHFYLKDIDINFFKNLKNKKVGFLYIFKNYVSHADPEYLASDLTEISIID